MPITLSTSAIGFGVHAIPFSEFPDLQRLHGTEAPGTAAIEIMGRALAADDFPVGRVEAFVYCVCKWGGQTGNRVRGNVFARNTPQEIRDRLSDAYGRLQQGDIDGALLCVNRIRGLGQPSYASKHLRFLAPELCPIMDSYISAELGDYPYGELGKMYTRIACELQSQQISNPMDRRDGQWWVADVDAVIFAHLRYARCACSPASQASTALQPGPPESDPAPPAMIGGLDSRLFGRWKGKIKDDRIPSYKTELCLAPSSVGGIGGTSIYDRGGGTTPGRGKLEMHAVLSSTEVRFRDTIDSGGDPTYCISGYVTVELAGDALQYRWNGPRSLSKPPSATGTLTRSAG